MIFIFLTKTCGKRNSGKYWQKVSATKLLPMMNSKKNSVCFPVCDVKALIRSFQESKHIEKQTPKILMIHPIFIARFISTANTFFIYFFSRNCIKPKCIINIDITIYIKLTTPHWNQFHFIKRILFSFRKIFQPHIG